MPRLGHDTILGGKTTSDKFHHPVSQSNKCFPIVLPPLKLSKNHHSSNYNSWSRSFLLKSAILLKTYARLDIGDQVYFLTTRLLHSSLNFFIVSALCVCGSGSRRVVRRALLLLLVEQQGLATCNNLHLLSVRLLSSSLFFPWYPTKTLARLPIHQDINGVIMLVQSHSDDLLEAFEHYLHLIRESFSCTLMPRCLISRPK